MFDPISLIPIGAFILFIFINVFYLCLSLRIAKLIVSKIWLLLYEKIYRKLDGSTSIKLISLTISAIFVPIVIPRILNSLLSFCVTLIYEFSNNSLNGWRETSRICDPGSAGFFRVEDVSSSIRLGDWIATCGYSLISEPTDSFLSSFINAFSSTEIYSFPFRSFLIFLAILFLSTKLLDNLEKGEVFGRRLDSFREPMNRFLQALKISAQSFLRNPIALSNTAFFLVIGVGLYLSIASIAAIPNLQAADSTQPEASVESLRERLNESLLSFRRDFPTSTDENVNSGINPFAQLLEAESDPLLNLKNIVVESQALNNEEPDLSMFKFLVENERIDYESSNELLILSVLRDDQKNELEEFLNNVSGNSQPVELNRNSTTNTSPNDETLGEQQARNTQIYNFSRSREEALSSVLRELDEEQYKELIDKMRSQIYEAIGEFNESSSFVNLYQNRRNALIESSKSFLSQANENLEGYLNSAINDYDVSRISRKGDRETFQHFLAIVSWFDAKVIDAKSHFGSCFESIQEIDSLLSERANSFESRLSQLKLRISEDPPYYNPYAPSQTVSRTFFESDSEEQNRQRLEELWDNATNICERSTFIINLDESRDLVPQRPDLGENLGPFSFVASWLLQTESLPLALITGLLGFGLLGAACSSFIQKQLSIPQSLVQDNQNALTTFNQRPLVEDLTRIIVIGFSAAILAFLSVLGGVSIFSSGEGDPNPYALLLICLIASVFGETFWKRAQARLAKDSQPSDNE